MCGGAGGAGGGRAAARAGPAGSAAPEGRPRRRPRSRPRLSRPRPRRRRVSQPPEPSSSFPSLNSNVYLSCISLSPPQLSSYSNGYLPLSFYLSYISCISYLSPIIHLSLSLFPLLSSISPSLYTLMLTSLTSPSCLALLLPLSSSIVHLNSLLSLLALTSLHLTSLSLVYQSVGRCAGLAGAARGSGRSGCASFGA